MEIPHSEAAELAESTSVFHPYRRSNLRSESYRTLVRILSHCYENAELSLETQFDPQELRAVNVSHLREEPREQVGGDFKGTESGDLAIEKVMEIEDNLVTDSVKDDGFNGTKVMMDGIEHMRTIERSGDAGDNQKTSGISSQCNHYVHEDNHSNELEHIMEGKEVLVQVDNNDHMRSSDHKNSENYQMSPEKLPKEIVDCQENMSGEGGSIAQEHSGTLLTLDGNKIEEVSEPKKDNQENRLSVSGKGTNQWPESQPKELEIQGMVFESDGKGSCVPNTEVKEVDGGQQRNDKVSEAAHIYLDKELSCKVPELSGINNDKATSLVVDVSNVEHEMLSKVIQKDGLPLICETVVSPNFTTENGDTEEGEICGKGSLSTTAILEDPIVLTEKVVDIQISADSINKINNPSIQANGNGMRPASLFSDITEYASHENKEDLKQDKSSMEAQTRVIVDYGFVIEERGYKTKDSRTKKGVGSFAAHASNNVPLDQVPKKCSTGHKEIVSTEKEARVCEKKKRGPLSEGKKEKKKLKKRKKRAENNRKLGVKRLKLHPVTVPKPVVYCRHFLKGRCHEGDKCKFSHDTIPLTKSSPCTHFARHSCMKGDDCPFDHELSKYPCSNFVSKGSCIRGDTCMFSHKVLQKEESTCTPNLKTEFKPPRLPDSVDSHRKPNSGGTLEQNLVVPYFTGTSRNSTPLSEAVPKKITGPPPVGINFLSFSTPSVYSSKIKPIHSSQDRNDNMEGRSVLNQSESCLLEHSNELSRKILSERTPKGINFLSFGKTSPEDSRTKKLVTPSCYDDGMKPSQLVNSSLQVSPSPFNASVTFGNQIQAISKTDQSSNELLKKAQTTTSKQMNLLFPKTLTGNYSGNELVGSSSDRKVDPDSSELNKISVHDTQESSSTIIPRQTGTQIASGQSSDSLASGLYKGGTSNSAQKAVFSTLAFAAKYESLMKKNKSSGSTSLSNENTNKSSASASVAVSNGRSNGGSNENTSRSLKNDQAKASKLLDFLLGLGG